MALRISDRPNFSYMLELDSSEQVTFSAAYEEDKDRRERAFQRPHRLSESWQNLRPGLHCVYYGNLEHIEASETLLRDFDKRTGEILEELHYRTPPFIRYEDMARMRQNLGACAVLLADSIGERLGALVRLDAGSIPDTPYALLGEIT